jgi:hypothetical protein
MTREQVFDFMAAHKYAVISVNAPAGGAPQSAVIGFAVTRDFEIVFDTSTKSRKYANLISNPACSLTVWSDEITVQFEGAAHELIAQNQAHYHEIYFATFPDGRDRLEWSAITHFVIRPRWMRYSNYQLHPPVIKEFHFE